jgi:hypothetical protein
MNAKKKAVVSFKGELQNWVLAEIGHSQMQNRPPRYVERKLLGRTGDSVDIDVAANTAFQKTAPAKAIPPLGPFILARARNVRP